MIITFANSKLKKWANDYRLSQRKLGPERARKFQERLNDLLDADSFAELQHLPGNYHGLKADRNGQWSCDLDHPYRLIFEPGTDPVPTNEHGTILLKKINIVAIIEIVDYH